MTLLEFDSEDTGNGLSLRYVGYERMMEFDRRRENAFKYGVMIDQREADTNDR